MPWPMECPGAQLDFSKLDPRAVTLLTLSTRLVIQGTNEGQGRLKQLPDSCRGAAMAATSAYISFLPQQAAPGKGWWTVLVISGLGPLLALVMLSIDVSRIAPVFPWLNSACGGAQLVMGLCVVRPLAWHTAHKRTRTCFGLGGLISLALLCLPYASITKGFLFRHQ